MALVWHPSQCRTPTVCQYWRNSRGNSRLSNSSNRHNNRHNRPAQVLHKLSFFFIFHIYYEKSWFYLAVVEVNLRLHINNHFFFFFLRRDIRADPSTFPLSGSGRLDHNCTARKHPPLYHPADPHDPHHAGHPCFRNLWHSTAATVCFTSHPTHPYFWW